MENRNLSHHVQAFKEKLRETSKALRDFELDKRVAEKTWSQPKRFPSLWSEIAQG